MTGWKETVGLSEDTALVKIYAPVNHKEQWREEAEEQDYSGMSEYLHELVQEARAYRDDGFLAHHRSEEEIEELKAKIQQLEEELERERQKEGGTVRVDDTEFLKRFLDYRYQSLHELIQKIVERGALEDLIRKPVEQQLYFLAQKGEVEYRSGHGWRLTEGGD